MGSEPFVPIYSRMYQDVLKIPAPWFIYDIIIDDLNKTERILLDFKKGATFECPKCGMEGCKPHDTHPEKKRHLDFHGFRCCLEARVPRVTCPNCGVSTINVPWGRKHSGFTYEYEMMILSLAGSMPISKVADMIHENFDRVFRIVSYYVNLAVSNSNYSQVYSIATDETSCKRGHKYITLVVDLDTRRIIFATEGKDHSTIDRFKVFLEEHKGDPNKILDGCCDMSQSFIKGLTENFPNISITFDKFHVMKLMNEALNQVRREEQKENNELFKTRMFWLKNRENLKEEEKAKLDKLLQMNLKTSRPELRRSCTLPTVLFCAIT